ncbi:MAG: lipoyl(octanoyl) transferase LipB, partial [Rhodococcus sp. (in: high G+C Gram-positive bacteria)]|uniref:lipoyl(octanoyl) transferase LipB n=1 Tax=Rhodococcus sp. TaxID=1831 RepID=UPI003316081F
MSSAAVSARFSKLPIAVEQLGLIDYNAAWARQRELAAARADDIGPDTLLLLEHPPVYTAGRRTEPEDRPVDGTPVIDVDRGGKITWHGPGQLVGYPIVKLAEPIDVVRYVRRIEEALITVCTDLGLNCGRIDGRSGVWLPADTANGQWKPERKVSAIGVRVQRGVALHGFALNCNSVLTGFDNIIPCGIRDFLDTIRPAVYPSVFHRDVSGGHLDTVHAFRESSDAGGVIKVVLLVQTGEIHLF